MTNKMKKNTLLFAFFFGLTVSCYGQFSEDFESGATIPAGWSVINLGGTNTWNIGVPYGFIPPTAHSGANVARISYNIVAHNDYLITPQITPIAGVSDRLSFWILDDESTFYSDHFEVRISTTNATTAASFSIVLLPNTPAPESWSKINLDLTPYIGQSIYIAFKAVSLNQNYMFIDDVANDTAPTVPPTCDATLSNPLDGATAAPVNGVISWSDTTFGDPTGYKIKVGTTQGGINTLPLTNVGNVKTYDVGTLDFDTTYYVGIVPYNSSGDATGCTEYSFTTRTIPAPGNLCENPIVVTLPYNTTDDTANYEDLNYEGTPGASGCGSTNDYLNGNDVVYSYTSTFTGSIKIVVTPDVSSTYLGLFIYNNCSAIGTNCIGGQVNGFSSNLISINEFPVISGQTYYFVMSTWASPQTSAYTLDITENTCTSSTVTYQIVSDCDNAPQFFVKVNITSLGSATSLTVSDDQSSPFQNATSTGIKTFGPYPNATPVIFTIANDQDASCVVVSPVQNQVICPPANDEPAGASELLLDLGTACGPNKIDLISNEGTTGSLEVVPSCGDYFPVSGNGDLWYKIIAPSSEFALNLTNIVSISGNLFSFMGALYSGTPGSLTEVTTIGNCGNSWPKTYTSLTQGTTYYLRIWDFDNDGIGTFSLCGYYLDCVNPTANYTVVNDCSNAPQFFVNTTISNLGSATSLTVSDDQSSPSQSVTASGLVTFGPYPIATPVIITIVNDQNAACTIVSPVQNQIGCPGPNDNLCNAISLTIGVNSSGSDYSNIASTVQASEPVPACFTNALSGSIWFSFIAPASGNVTVTTDILGATLTDTQIAVYASTGVSCNDLTTLGTEIGCDEDSGTVVGAPFNTFNSILDLPSLTPGALYYIQVDKYSAFTTAGTFGIDIIDNDPLAASNFDSKGFASYPNPVVNILTLSYSKNIDKVQVLNLLGQEVISKSINATDAKVDMSALASGTYLVKITTDSQIKTLKVIKQ
jgi:Secretion system C-terminal sorting domain/Cleaved Adhesin Domain